MKERRTILSGVLQFLHTNRNSAIDDTDLDMSWTQEIDEMFQSPSKSKIEAIIKEILLRLNGSDTNIIYPHVRKI